MTILLLAYRNLIGAGLRTWLNVFVLSLCYLVIIFNQGLYRGMNEQVSQARISQELGGGVWWHEAYDPLDPFSLQDAHGPLSPALQQAVAVGDMTPILIRQATIYPEGRLVPVLLKGIDPDQKILDFPTSKLTGPGEPLPVLIGGRMAASAGLKEGDLVILRWRDVNGTFDARDARVAAVHRTDVQSIDSGQLWVPLQELQRMVAMAGQATLVVTARQGIGPEAAAHWVFRDLNYLMRDLHEMIKSKNISSAFLYGLLLFLALLTVFNAQVLAIFRRCREIGTMMALGMTRGRVILLFTVEGGLNGLLAALLGAVYGIPLLAWLSANGLQLPKVSEDYGFSLGAALYPIYSAALVLGTLALVLVMVTIVSYLPSRRIARMEPTEALRGKIT